MTGRLETFAILLNVAGLAALGCGGGSQATGAGGHATGGGGAGGAGGLLAEVQALLDARCLSCHNPSFPGGPSGALDLTDVTALVRPPAPVAAECSSASADPNLPQATVKDDKLVVRAHDPLHSYLVDKISPGAGGDASASGLGSPQIAGTCFAGGRMPLDCVAGAATNPCLTTAEIQIIVDWVHPL